MNDQSLTTEHNASSESMEESHALIMGFRKAFIAYLLENTPQNEDQLLTISARIQNYAQITAAKKQNKDPKTLSLEDWMPETEIIMKQALKGIEPNLEYVKKIEALVEKYQPLHLEGGTYDFDVSLELQKPLNTLIWFQQKTFDLCIMTTPPSADNLPDTHNDAYVFVQKTEQEKKSPPEAIYFVEKGPPVKITNYTANAESVNQLAIDVENSRSKSKKPPAGNHFTELPSMKTDEIELQLITTYTQQNLTPSHHQYAEQLHDIINNENLNKIELTDVYPYNLELSTRKAIVQLNHIVTEHISTDAQQKLIGILDKITEHLDEKDNLSKSPAPNELLNDFRSQLGAFPIQKRLLLQPLIDFLQKHLPSLFTSQKKRQIEGPALSDIKTKFDKIEENLAKISPSQTYRQQLSSMRQESKSINTETPVETVQDTPQKRI